MKTLRDYEELIRTEVIKVNVEDPNWIWSVKSFAKNRVRIRWGYLDYLQEKDNCFTLDLVPYEEDYTVISHTPEGEMIDGYIVVESENRKPWQETFENSIVRSIKAIANYAHSRY